MRTSRDAGLAGACLERLTWNNHMRFRHGIEQIAGLLLAGCGGNAAVHGSLRMRVQRT